MAFSLSLPLFRPKSRLPDLSGRMMLGLGLGGVAAVAAAFGAYRVRSLRRGTLLAAPIRLLAAPEPQATWTQAGSSGSRAKADANRVEAAPLEETDPEITSQEWASGGAPMDTLIPGSYAVPDMDSSAARETTPNLPISTGPLGDPDLAMPAASDSGTEPLGEPWLETLRTAMERKPLQFGFDKSVWNAPLLAEYLMRTHGINVPVPRIRAALKDMGYQWKNTRYARVRNGNAQEP
ncbi:MAG: hypothetical protein JWP91_313 [Fibrobacteres bacterium]|nr:hypothetical protein [Fibrobacterota bacterium]